METLVSKENAHICMRKIRIHRGCFTKSRGMGGGQGEGHKSIKQKKVKPKKKILLAR